MKERLLIIEDDELLAKVFSIHFEKQGYDVLVAAGHGDAFRLAAGQHPSAVIVDVTSEAADGWDLCRQVKELTPAPVLVLTGKGDATDILRGCEAGADDYMRKPICLAEISARIRTLVDNAGSDTPSTDLVLRCGDLELDLRHHRTTLRGESIVLTPAEFRLLAYMMQNRGRLLTPDDLLARVWGSRYLGEHRYLGLCVRYLRGKLTDDPSSPGYIASVRDQGYRIL